MTTFIVEKREDLYRYFVSYKGAYSYGNAVVTTESEIITYDIIQSWERQLAERVNIFGSVTIMFFHKL